MKAFVLCARQGAFLFLKIILHFFVWYNFFPEDISPGFRGFYHFNNFCIPFTGTFLQCCNCFLRHNLPYLISLWTVTFLSMGLYFFNSRRSDVFFLFFVVMYLEVPGSPLSLCSVHSRITWTLFPFLAIVLYLYLNLNLNLFVVPFFLCFLQCFPDTIFIDGT